jgi:hypothetical protein
VDDAREVEWRVEHLRFTHIRPWRMATGGTNARGVYVYEEIGGEDDEEKVWLLQ